MRQVHPSYLEHLPESMTKPPKKKTKARQKSVEGAPPTSNRVGAHGNLGKGILRCPVELQNEILDYYLPVGPTSGSEGYFGPDPVLHPIYLERTTALRTLSQVSLDYRRVFLPLLYETLNVCCAEQSLNRVSFYKHVGDTLRRKSRGLIANPQLASYVR